MNADVVYWSVVEDWDDEDINEAIQWIIDAQVEQGNSKPALFFRSCTVYFFSGVASKGRGKRMTTTHAMVFTDEPITEAQAEELAKQKMELDGTWNPSGLA